MIQDNNESPNMEDNKTTASRRKFLTKASAGALISTIPAKSVWATGLTSSITASGHGSDFGGTQKVILKDVHFWRNYPHYIGSIGDVDFAHLFGANAFRTNSGARHSEKLTLNQVLFTQRSDGSFRYPGPGGINWNLITIVLNAHHHGRYGIHYPIAGPGRPFYTVGKLASHLNFKFAGDATLYASQLQTVIYHRG